MSEDGELVRVIVCALGGEEHPWRLPASRIVHRTWIHGGERSLYELAWLEAELEGLRGRRSVRAATRLADLARPWFAARRRMAARR